MRIAADELLDVMRRVDPVRPIDIVRVGYSARSVRVALRRLISLGFVIPVEFEGSRRTYYTLHSHKEHFR